MEKRARTSRASHADFFPKKVLGLMVMLYCSGYADHYRSWKFVRGWFRMVQAKQITYDFLSGVCKDFMLPPRASQQMIKEGLGRLGTAGSPRPPA